eukprot:4503101-Prymnesium_polylepis.1
MPHANAGTRSSSLIWRAPHPNMAGGFAAGRRRVPPVRPALENPRQVGLPPQDDRSRLGRREGVPWPTLIWRMPHPNLAHTTP